MSAVFRPGGGDVLVWSALERETLDPARRPLGSLVPRRPCAGPAASMEPCRPEDARAGAGRPEDARAGAGCPDSRGSTGRGRSSRGRTGLGQSLYSGRLCVADLGRPRPELDINLNPGASDPSHKGTCPGTRMEDAGPSQVRVVDGEAPLRALYLSWFSKRALQNGAARTKFNKRYKCAHAIFNPALRNKMFCYAQ